MLKILLAYAFLLAILAAAAENAKPPVAKKIPHVEMLHGDQRVDDYFWLREKTNPDVKTYLEAENAYAESVLAPFASLRETLYKEMLGRIKQTDTTAPYRKGGYLYYSRTEEGKQYSIYCRKKGTLEAAEAVFLDLNELAKGERFMAAAAMQVADDEQQLAYTTDNVGFRQYRLFVKDLTSGKVTGPIAEKVGSVAWAADNKTLFYTVEDSAKRQYRLYRHELGSDAHDLVYEEKDERFRVGVQRTRSKAYLILQAESHTTSEARYLSAATPRGEFKMIQAREPEHEYAVDHNGDRFYIRTNDKGRNFRIVSAPVSAPGKARWHEEVPHKDKVMLDDFDMFAGYMTLFEREGGLPHIRVIDLKTKASHRIAVPEAAYDISPGTNADFDTKTYRYNYQSFTTPPSNYDYDLASRKATLVKRVEILGGFDPDKYQSERITAKAADGTEIPISLVYRKGLKKDGSAPMLLSAYGSYGYSRPLTFSSVRASLLDRGVTYALAHIRGGGEMGKAWHDQGRMMNKRNTFTDFIACAEHLVNQQYTARERLVIEGGSAGGLLMGAVTNMRPDLFKAVIAHVPFVDVINTMLDESLPLTIGEFEEWGNPKKRDEYYYMKTYCPYSNLDRRGFPSMLVKTSFDDSQVMYHEPAKYVAKMRTLKTDSNPLLFYTNMAGGHGGSSGRYDRLREEAFDYAFLLWQVGLAK
ncbi:MAG: S9 family peptidase [Bryobacteraceae bacterium]